MKVHNIVNVTVTSTDTQLLDDIEAELPENGAPAVGPEYDGPKRITNDPALDSGEERVAARVSFVAGTVEVDGTTYDGETEATDLYDRLVALSLPEGSVVKHYLSPVGAVSTSEVQQWYEDNPDSQPTDDEGEPYIPSSWSPSHHVVSSFR